MIVTITLNPAVDKTLLVPGFKPGVTNRATIERIEVGGKGINVARNLTRLGCDVVATGFLDAGDRHGFATTLAQQGIESDFVHVAGDARVNLKVIDPLAGLETEINEPGFSVPAEAIAALGRKLQVLARRSSVLVFSGSLPPDAPADLYARLIAQARAEGARTVLDAAGDALARGIAARPDLVKPNRAEAEELLDAPIGEDGSLVIAAQRLLGLGAGTVVISLGPDGALSASPAGIWRARPPRVAARSTVGAGDAMVAALAFGLMWSLAPPDALRLATAASSAAAATAGPPAANRIEALLPQVAINVVPPVVAASGSPSGPPNAAAALGSPSGAGAPREAR